MKRRYRFPLLAAMMAAWLVTAPFRGSAADNPPDSNEPCFDLTISAGLFEAKPGQKFEATIDHLADFLREKTPGLNIVLSPNVGSIKVENLKLRAATMKDLMLALEIATDREVSGSRMGDRTYALMARSKPERPSNFTVEAFNLRAYLQGSVFHADGGNSPEQRAKRIDEALARLEGLIGDTVALSEELNGVEKTRPKIRFHAGAWLLIVAGTPKQIEVVRKVVMALAPGSAPAVEPPK